MKGLSYTSMGNIIGVGVCCLVVGLMAGCATLPITPDQDTTWYLQPSGAYHINDAKVFYGVGRAAPLQNRTLQRVSADNQARLEMARLLDRYSVALSQTAKPSDARRANPPKELEPTLKALVHQAMQRAIVTEHWADPDQGRLFALCRLNLADFEAALRVHRGLGTDLRAAMISNLELVHDRLSKDVGKNQ